MFKSYRANATIDSSYIYDAFDRASTETETHNDGPARTTDFTYLGISSQVSAETRRGSSASTHYTYDVNDRRVGARMTGSSPQEYSFARNPRGDVSLLVDDAGALRASYAHRPYGELDLRLARGDNDPTDTFNPFRFNDRRFDSGSRSIDMGARRYDPDDGRFVHQDFLRNSDEEVALSLDSETQNRYGFAGGNPVTFVKTDGHVVVPDGGGGTPSCARVKRSFFILGREDAILLIRRRTGKGGAGRKNGRYWYGYYLELRMVGEFATHTTPGGGFLEVVGRGPTRADRGRIAYYSNVGKTKPWAMHTNFQAYFRTRVDMRAVVNFSPPVRVGRNIVAYGDRFRGSCIARRLP